MRFEFYIATRVFFGRNCVKDNKAEFAKYGRRAFIVTGGRSGRLSGALDDAIGVLDELKIEHCVYDKIENNPSLECVKEGGVAARRFKADYVVGIGGGSPLDAAKAIAVLAVNCIEPVDLFKNVFENKPLPVICIPTTAGTGSEVTPYSVLTRKDMGTKKSFGNEDTFPKASFLDAGYTESMPHGVAVNTAIDALSHAVEGYLSRKSMPVSDVLAEESIRLFGECSENLLKNSFDSDARDKLLYMSMLGGMVITHTRTSIVHAMGYTLTYFKDIPHGKANGIFMKEYLKFNYEHAREKTDNILRLLKVSGIEEFGVLMDRLLHIGAHDDLRLGKEELKLFASITADNPGILNNITHAGGQDILRIMEASLKQAIM